MISLSHQTILDYALTRRGLSNAGADRLLSAVSDVDGLPYGVCSNCGKRAEIYGGGVCEQCVENERAEWDAANEAERFDGGVL